MDPAEFIEERRDAHGKPALLHLPIDYGHERESCEPNECEKNFQHVTWRS